MSDWLKEVEHASCSVQYIGSENELNPLISAPRNESRFVKIFWVVFLMSVFGVGACIGTYLILEELDGWPQTTPYYFINRKGWNAKEITESLQELKLPATQLVITQTSTDPCSTTSSCVRAVRQLQKDHIDKKFLSDIAYSLLVGGDGATYEGRGWRTQAELMDNQDKNSIVVALIGSFYHTVPSKKQIEELKLVIEDALDRGALNKCFKLVLYVARNADLNEAFEEIVKENKWRRKLNSCTDL